MYENLIYPHSSPSVIRPDGGGSVYEHQPRRKHRLDNAKTEIKKLADKDEIKNGDLIFQTSLSGQSKAIQVSTHSKYSHCGLIYKDGNDFFVFEAVQPVKRTPLDKWIARGENGKFVIKRLKNAEQILTPTTLQKMKQVGEEFMGKNYDLTFEWSDNKIYCSELIWKVFAPVGLPPITIAPIRSPDRREPKL